MFKGPLPLLVNHRKLVSDKARLEGTIPFDSLGRFTDLLLDKDGDVQARLEFRKGKRQKTLVVGNLQAAVSVTCQKCLEPMTLALETNFRTLILKTDEELDALEQEDDGFVCPDEMLPLTDLIEDELIVGMPMVTRHEACEIDAALAPEPEEIRGKGDTYKPFAALADMKDKLTRS
ncbi:MAG: DUF177 domain-containing protein [Pseudomonadales bacterium]|nr:DUF177 domain-containing protein [Pseudomonadales bacterium]